MDLPKCRNKKCPNISTFYLESKKLYVCQSCCHSKYSKVKPELLVTAGVPQNMLKTLGECIKLFSFSIDEDDDEELMEECKSLISKYDEEINQLEGKLQKAISEEAYHEFIHVQSKAQNIFSELKKEPLYIEFASQKIYDQTSERVTAGGPGPGHEDEPEDPAFLLYDVEDSDTKKLLSQNIQEMKKFKGKLEEVMNNEAKHDEVKDMYEPLNYNIQSLLEHIDDLKRNKDEEIRKYEELYKSELEQKGEMIKILHEQAENETKRLKQQAKQTEQELEENEEKVKGLFEMQEEIDSKLFQEPPPPKIDEQITNPGDVSYTNDEFNNFHEIVLGWKCSISVKFEIEIICNNETQFGLIESPRKRFPPLHRICLNNVKEEDKEKIVFFMKNFLPKKFRIFSITPYLEILSEALKSLQILNFLYMRWGSELINIDSYFSHIIGLKSSIIRALRLWNFRISQRHIVRIFTTFKHLEEISPHKSILEINSVPNLEHRMKESRIKKVNVYQCGSKERGDWENDNSPLLNLLAGLAQSEDFRIGLELFYAVGCDITKEEFRKILENNGFGHVEDNL